VAACTIALGDTALAAPGDDGEVIVVVPQTATRTDDDEAEERDGRRDTTRDDGEGDVNGAEDSHVRIHVDSEAIGGAWSRLDNGADSISFGAGLARPSLISRPLFGFGVGWVFARDRAILGAKMAITAEGFDLGSSRRSAAIGGRFVPYLHWMFRPQRAVRPYLEARVGIGGTAASTRVSDGGRVDHLFYPTAGAGLGMHVFPRDYFSFDLGFNVDYAAPYRRTTFKSNDTPDRGWRKSADVLNFGLLLGISTWF
jgi:hypothetical protein